MEQMPRFSGIWKEALEREWVRNRLREWIQTVVTTSTVIAFATVLVVLVARGTLWLIYYTP